MTDFLCQIEVSLLKMLKISGFLFKIPFFCLNCQIPGFYKFPGNVATLEGYFILKS